jgi:Mn-dependent DtxR family transcriptional regulator
MIPPHLEQYFKTADSRSLDVLFWLLRNQDNIGNLVTTLDFVASECNVTKVTVNKTFQKLYKAGYMQKICNGHYRLIGVEPSVVKRES